MGIPIPTATSIITPENPRVYRVPRPAGGVNLAQLREEIVAALPERLWSVNEHVETPEALPVEYSIDFGFVSPPDVGELAQVEAVVGAHNPAVLTAEQRAEEEKGADFADLRSNVASVLADAATALGQIDVDFTSLAADITALNAATTLAQARPPIVDSMQILGRTLNRQRRVIQSLVYAVRVIRWFVGSE